MIKSAGAGSHFRSGLREKKLTAVAIGILPVCNSNRVEPSRGHWHHGCHHFYGMNVAVTDQCICRCKLAGERVLTHPNKASVIGYDRERVRAGNVGQEEAGPHDGEINRVADGRKQAVGSCAKIGQVIRHPSRKRRVRREEGQVVGEVARGVHREQKPREDALAGWKKEDRT